MSNNNVQINNVQINNVQQQNNNLPSGCARDATRSDHRDRTL